MELGLRRQTYTLRQFDAEKTRLQVRLVLKAVQTVFFLLARHFVYSYSAAVTDNDKVELTVPLADGGCRLVVVHGEVTRGLVPGRRHCH